jgi:hypothetical protein
MNRQIFALAAAVSVFLVCGAAYGEDPASIKIQITGEGGKVSDGTNTPPKAAQKP